MKLIALNTIGLTGVEVFQTYLAELDEVYVLPGQNFTLHSQNLYRPFDFTGRTATEVFDTLNRQLLTKAGRIWIGLTKYMDKSTLEIYSHEKHKKLFISRLGDRRQFFECVEEYSRSYYLLIQNSELGPNKWLSYYSCNVVLNLPYYEGKMPERILNVGNRIDFWLEACKFFIVNNLYLKLFQTKNSNLRTFFLEDMIKNPEKQKEEIQAFLGISARKTDRKSSGLILPRRLIIEETILNAAKLRKIYSEEPLFKLADTIEKWGSEFTSNPEISFLLDRFAKFWNTTAHTNFDWVGPIAEEIVSLALNQYSLTGKRNINTYFYHEYFNIQSDSHESINSHLHHYLGFLEQEIILPYLPYFLKVAMTYLICISKNYVYHSHSYIPVRQSDIYRRLCTPEAIKKIAHFGLSEKMLEVEISINAAEEACAYLR
jgi:hypothetical protein